MLKKVFSFEGRIRRTEYGISCIIYTIIAVIMNIAIRTGNFNLLFLVIYIPLLWFMIAQAAKRCHDLNHSGWYQLIPFYGLWLLFAQGTTGSNDYGPDPKDSNAIEDSTISNA